MNYSVQGASGEVFNRYWDKYVGGDDSYLGQQAQQAQQLAATLLDFAQQLEYTKWAINTQLAILAVQVAYDLLAAPFTQGLSMAEAFLAVYMARSVIRMIVARLLESVLFMALPDLVAQTIQLANAWSHGKDGSFDGKRLLTDVEMGVVAGSLGALLQPLMQWRPMTGAGAQRLRRPHRRAATRDGAGCAGQRWHQRRHVLLAQPGWTAGVEPV